MAGVVFGGTVTLADDADMRMAELARQIAENEEDWLKIKACSANRSGESSPPVTVEDDEEVSQCELAKANTTLLDTTSSSFGVPDDAQELRVEKEKLNIELDQARKQLASKTLAHDEALVQIKLQGEQLEKKSLAYAEALEQVKTLQEEVVVRDGLQEALTYKLEQLKGASTCAKSFMDRMDRLYTEKDKDKDHIQSLSEERLRLFEDLRRKDERSAQLQKQVFQFEDQLGSLQLQLGSMKAVESQLIDKIAEVDCLKVTLAKLNTQEDAQSDELRTVRAELKDAHETNKTQIKEIAALKSDISPHRFCERKMWDLTRDIAFYITHLDLAYDGCRVFDCAHDSLSSLSNLNKSTLQRNARMIATEFFRDWANDKQFMDQYRLERQYVIDHHRAHERSNTRGRGAMSSRVRDILTRVDGCRHVSLKYT